MVYLTLRKKGGFLSDVLTAVISALAWALVGAVISGAITYRIAVWQNEKAWKSLLTIEPVSLRDEFHMTEIRLSGRQA